MHSSPPQSTAAGFSGGACHQCGATEVPRSGAHGANPDAALQAAHASVRRLLLPAVGGGATTLRTRWWFSCPAGSRSDWHRTGTDTENSGRQSRTHLLLGPAICINLTSFWLRDALKDPWGRVSISCAKSAAYNHGHCRQRRRKAKESSWSPVQWRRGLCSSLAGGETTRGLHDSLQVDGARFLPVQAVMMDWMLALPLRAWPARAA